MAPDRRGRSGSLHTAIEVFVNGLTGVFAGMAMLYLAIKVIAAFAGRQPAKED